MRVRQLQARRSAAAVLIQAVVRGPAARRKIGQLQQERSALIAKELCGEQETAETCICQKQQAENIDSTVDALPAGYSSSSIKAVLSSSERVADPAESTHDAAYSRECAAVPDVLGKVSRRMLPVLASKGAGSAEVDVVILGTAPSALAEGADGPGSACWGSALDTEEMQHCAAARLCRDGEGQRSSEHPACDASPCGMSRAHAACKAPQGSRFRQRHVPQQSSAQTVDCCRASSEQRRAVSVLHASTQAANMSASTSSGYGTTHACAWMCQVALVLQCRHSPARLTCARVLQAPGFVTKGPRICSGALPLALSKVGRPQAVKLSSLSACQRASLPASDSQQ